MNNEQPQNKLTLWQDTPVQADATTRVPPPIKTSVPGQPEEWSPEPPQPVPEEFPLTVGDGTPSPPPCEILQTIDLGVLPWSKQPIREITPLIWFRYEREEFPVISGAAPLVIYNVIDGNGRTLFCVNEEGMANFFCNAANVYVHASLTTQV